MHSSNVGRWLAAGCCVVVVAALQFGGAPNDIEPSASRDAVARTRARIAAAPVVRIARIPTLTQPQPIALDIAVARKAARDGLLRVALPDGTSYPLRIERQETDRFGAWSLIGHVRSPAGPQAAVLTFGHGAVFGTLPMPNGDVLQVATNHGDVVATLAGGITPPGGVSAAPDIATIPVKRGAVRPLVPMLAKSHVRTLVDEAPATPAAPTQQATANAMPQAAAAPLSPITVTVLATYADDLLALRGSAAAVQTELSNLIAAANQSHIDSGSRVRLSLVGTAKLAIPADWSNTDALYAMTVAPIDTVDTEVLRNTYSADLVTFVRPFADYENCGIAWVGGAGLNGANTDSLFAYSVVNREPCGPHVMAHETGHNLGAAHDRQTETDDFHFDPNFGAFTDSFGWRGWSGREFADVMSYNTHGEPWLGVFASPLIAKCNGKPCGVAGQADVVRTFDRMAQTVSDFRRTNGKGSVSDARVQSFCAEFEKLIFPIRLSVQRNTVASVDVEVVSGANYASQSSTGPQHIEFAPFQQQADFEVETYPSCGNLPNGRQVTVKLSNPVGFTLEDDTAVGTIEDIEPVRITGFLTRPNQWFGEQMTLTAAGAHGSHGTHYGQTLGSPWYFEIDVAPGSNVRLDATDYIYPSWIIEPTFLTDVRTPTPVPLNIPIIQPIGIEGELFLPDSMGGYTLPPSGAFSARFRSTYKGRVLIDDVIQLGSGFRRYVMPGSNIQIQLSSASNAPIPSYVYRQFDVRTSQQIDMHTLDIVGAFPVGDRPVREGPHGQRTIVPIGIQLTGPAPATGATVYWRTVDGTAVAGSDYVGASGTVNFTAGETFKQVAIQVIGDSADEANEYFDVELYQATGVGITTNKSRIDVLRDEKSTGGPGQKTATQ